MLLLNSKPKMMSIIVLWININKACNVKLVALAIREIRSIIVGNYFKRGFAIFVSFVPHTTLF